MKLVIVFALFALAAARFDPSPYEPIHVGPGVIDFEPEAAIGPIDKEAILDVLRRLRDFIKSLRPQGIHVGAEPIDFEPIVVDSLEPVFVRPTITLEDLIQWILDLFNRLRPRDMPLIQRPPINSIEELKEFIREIIERLREKGIELPDISLPQIDLVAIRDAVCRYVNKIWPNKNPCNSRPDSFQEALERIIAYIRGLIPEGGMPRPPRPDLNTLHSIRVWMSALCFRVFPTGCPVGPGSNIASLEDMLNWIKDMIDSIKNQTEEVPPQYEESPIIAPEQTPSSSPLVQIIVNVKNAASVSGAQPEPTPVHIVE